MTDTVVSSPTREVVIGSGRPFVIIGERINPTGRKKLAEEMKVGDFSTVIVDALAQVEAGAQMLDVNAGIPLADEPRSWPRPYGSSSRSPTCRCRSTRRSSPRWRPASRAYQGKPLVNSVTGEDERLEQVLPLVAKYGAAVVAITNDETGISEDPNVRFAVAEKIVHRAADHGIAREDIVVDPLVMPIGAMGTAGRQVFALVRRLRRARRELDVRRLQRELRSAQPQHVERCVPHHGDRFGDDVGDHQPAPRRGARGGHGRGRDDGQRPRLPGVDRSLPRAAGRCGRRTTRRQGGQAWHWRRRRRGVTSPVSAEVDALVVFTPSASAGGARDQPARGRSVARRGPRLGVAAGGICGRCQIVVSEGEFAKHGISSGAAHLTPFSVPEQTYSARSVAPERRLGCHACVVGDLVVDVPPESQLHRQVVRKEADAHVIEVDPIVRLHYVEVREPDMSDPSGRTGEGAAARGDEARLVAHRSRLRRPRVGRVAANAPGGRLDRDRCRARRRHRRRVAGIPRPRARGGVRRRIDDGGGPAVRPGERERARGGRRDEPADPVRRGPDEPRVLRDDGPDPRPCSPRRRDRVSTS